MFKKDKNNFNIDNIFSEVTKFNTQNYSFDEAFFILYDYLQKIFFECNSKYGGGFFPGNWYEFEDTVILIFYKLDEYEEFEKFLQFKLLYDNLEDSKIYKKLNLTDTFFCRQKLSEYKIFEGYLEGLLNAYEIKNNIVDRNFSQHFKCNASMFYEARYKKENKDLLKVFAIKINKEESKILKNCKQNFDKNFDKYFNSAFMGEN